MRKALEAGLVAHLDGHVLELDRAVARLEHLVGLHPAEQLEDVALGAAQAQSAVDAGFAVVDVAEQLAAGARDLRPGGLQRGGVGDLEADVVIAAAHGVLDQDQLVVALVAR